MSVEILKVGTWLYDGTAEKPVDIVGLPYDWWFSLAEADEMLEPGEVPMPLNEKGLLYYVRFRSAGEANEPIWVDSVGYQDIYSAIEYAESKVAGHIQWQNT